MAEGGVKLTGFRELEAALGQFTKSTERGILKRVATQALEPFLEEAKRLVPVDEGTLRDSLVIGTSLNRSAKRAERKEPKDGVRVYAGTASRNAVPREFGALKDGSRERVRAQPYMRPAWDQKQDEVLDRVVDGLKPEIDKTAARVARRAARKL